MSYVHTLRTASAFANFRDTVANQHNRRRTKSDTSQKLLGDKPGGEISQSSASGKRACGLERELTPVSYPFGYRQSCKLHAFSRESEGHRPGWPEVRLEDRVDVFQYHHKDDPLGQDQTGVIAQKLFNELPDTVVRDPATGLLSVRLDKLLAYAINGVQEACSALKELDAKQPMGMSILMQLQSDSTTQKIDTSLAPKHKAPDFDLIVYSDSLPASNASQDSKTGSMENNYQKRLLDCLGKGGNHIISLASSTVLPLSSLSCAGVFRAAQGIPSGVEFFSSYNPISAHSLPLLIKHNHVLVMTAQVFLNLLEAGDASLDAFDMMVFDECHHTQKNNPFNKVALKYSQLTAEQQAHLQILGLTATPAVAPSMTETHAQLDSLRSNMCASFLVVPHDDAEVRQVVGETHEVLRQVGGRSEDVSFAVDLSRVLRNHFVQFAQHDLASQGAVAEILSSLIVGKGSGRLTGLLGTHSINCPDHLLPNLQLLQVCNTALDLNKDTGFELPMRLLAGTCLAIQTPELQMPTQGSSETSQMEMKDSTSAAITTSTVEISETTAASMRQALMQDLASKVYKCRSWPTSVCSPSLASQIATRGADSQVQLRGQDSGLLA